LGLRTRSVASVIEDYLRLHSATVVATVADVGDGGVADSILLGQVSALRTSLEPLTNRPRLHRGQLADGTPLGHVVRRARHLAVSLPVANEPYHQRGHVEPSSDARNPLPGLDGRQDLSRLTGSELPKDMRPTPPGIQRPRASGPPSSPVSLNLAASAHPL